MKIIDISIIIVNYNSFFLTKRCIESIIDKTKQTNYEIIIIDNGSKDFDPQLLANISNKVNVIKNKNNLGFGRANNVGIDHAKGNYLLFLNSDTYLINEAIDHAYNFALDNNNIKIFGADIRNEDLTVQRSFFPKSNIGILSAVRSGFLYENPVLYKILMVKRKPQTLRTDNVGGLYGSYIFIHHSVIKRLGGFDTDFFMYCEDTEWFRNRIARHYEIKICKDSTIVHIGGGSSEDLDGVRVNRQNMLSYFLYWYKLGKLHFCFYSMGVYLNLIFLILLLPIVNRKRRSYLKDMISAKIRILRWVIFDIPRYPNTKNSRPFPLKYHH